MREILGSWADYEELGGGAVELGDARLSCGAWGWS